MAVRRRRILVAHVSQQTKSLCLRTTFAMSVMWGRTEERLASWE
ncbi:hypothetical protein FBUS_09240 [Fasciolopsis buskii]|uniref:Uncharacterized protein n=1 Tax=Fasciolopsis buskii TaxID=27845 RepID=A0A8E0VFV2_9TREM|nr:hypothetical protein FBUS_09240 [Fasciolopsis buski]